MKDVMPFLNMFDNISLPRAVEEDVKAIKEIVKYHDGGGFVTEEWAAETSLYFSSPPSAQPPLATGGLAPSA
eukprot:3605882-Pyramimonas_sp.AAC.1